MPLAWGFKCDSANGMSACDIFHTSRTEVIRVMDLRTFGKVNRTK